MKIRGKQITEGMVLTVLGLIFFTVVGSLWFHYRREIAWFRFMMDTGNIFALIDKFERTTDPAEKLNIAVKISYHSAKNSLAQIHQISKSIEKDEPMPEMEAEPTGREGAVIKKSLEYVEWAYSLVDYYIGKIPPAEVSKLMAGSRAKLVAEDFKDDFTDEELAKAFPSFGKIKPCTFEDYSAVVKAAGEENVLKYSGHVFTANLRVSSLIGAEAGNEVLRKAIQLAESGDHKKILSAILEIQEMSPPLSEAWVSSALYKKSKDWPEVKELVMPFRRAAPHCFQTKNYRSYMGFQKAALTSSRAQKLAERLVQHIRQHGKAPENLRDLENLEYSELRDAWYSDFKFERTESEIVISSAGEDRKAGTQDDFVHRREFILGGE